MKSGVGEIQDDDGVVQSSIKLCKWLQLWRKWPWPLVWDYLEAVVRLFN